MRSGDVLLRGGGEDFIPRSEMSFSEAGIRIGQGRNPAGFFGKLHKKVPPDSWK
ncbi:hypothetical protein GCWU000341_01567 [Oribacterium sp. oral taxon 078 str. F0262]|nr:hypothetical protein GCWU000341_01567 [Oribacterium sp. oral taxon 078 str. F0262]